MSAERHHLKSDRPQVDIGTSGVDILSKA